MTWGLAEIGTAITATGALGTAAVGLVDSSKFAWGGVANIGFWEIAPALERYEPTLTRAIGKDWRKDFLSFWRNGRPKEEQKARAVAVVMLGLTSDIAREVAKAGDVDGDKLAEAVAALEQGAPLSDAQVQLIGRFKATIEVRLDAAFERADRIYRNGARVMAGVVALALALAANQIVAWPDPDAGPVSLLGLQFARHTFEAVMVGILAVPIAPVAKDLLTALTTAVGAVRR